MSTYIQVQVKLAAYMQRDISTFIVTDATSGTTVNLLQNAINSARRWAEMEHNFEQNRVQTQLNVDLVNGTDISAMTLAGTNTTVNVKTLAKAFLNVPSGSDCWIPVDCITRDKHVERVERHFERVTPQLMQTIQNQKYPLMLPFFNVVRAGNIIYLTPNDANPAATTVLVRFDAYKWLPDYSANGDTDFFLTQCEEFILMRAVWHLNFFLKEDQRIPVSDKALSAAWHSVLAWDNNMIISDSADSNLD